MSDSAEINVRKMMSAQPIHMGPLYNSPAGLAMGTMPTIKWGDMRDLHSLTRLHRPVTYYIAEYHHGRR